MSAQPAERPVPHLTLVTAEPSVGVPVGLLEQLLGLLQGAAELREQEVAAAYAAGRRDPDPAVLELAWHTAQEVAQDRLERALLVPWRTDPLPCRLARRRIEIAAWVAPRPGDYTGGAVPWGDS